MFVFACPHVHPSSELRAQLELQMDLRLSVFVLFFSFFFVRVQIWCSGTSQLPATRAMAVEYLSNYRAPRESRPAASSAYCISWMQFPPVASVCLSVGSELKLVGRVG